jgi:Lrp/AsnC family transcriptional regulator for asnA, asnC and gidA
MGRQQCDLLDIKILRTLSTNARKPVLEIARECKVSGAAVHQRIQRLTQLGIIKGYECLIDPASIGYETCAYMGFFLRDPADFSRVVDELINIPEIVECHYTTGQYDIFIKILARNNDHLLQIIHDKITSLGLGRTETLISFKEVIKRQAPISDPNE